MDFRVHIFIILMYLFLYFFLMAAVKPDDGKVDPKTAAPAAAQGTGDGGGDGVDVNAAKIAELRETLKAREIAFTEENTLEELEAILAKADEPAKPETAAEKKAREKKEKDAAKFKEKLAESPALNQIVERRSARMQERQDYLDRVNVFTNEATNWGPRFVVIEMSKVDVASFGPKVVTETDLPLGTRVDRKGRELEDEETLDKDGNIEKGE